MIRAFPPKAPDDRLDYGFIFPLLRDGESLLTNPAPVVSASPGLTIDAVLVSGCEVIAWIEGGTPQTLCTLTCTAQTSQGRTLVGEATLFVGAVGLDQPCPIAPPGW